MAWNDEFYNYDFIGALTHHKVTKPKQTLNSGFCWRSKRILDECHYLDFEIRPYFDDTIVCYHRRDLFEKRGYKFAPYPVAKAFSKGADGLDFPDSFGFHDYRYSDPLGIEQVQRQGIPIEFNEEEDEQEE